MKTSAPDILPCTCCRPECEAQHRADVVVTQMRTLNTAADIARNFDDKDTYQHIVDLMIKIENAYYDAGYDMELYALAKNLRGAK